MKFMMIVKANSSSEAGVMPTADELTTMTKYNEELISAGVMLAGEGLHPSSKGARIEFAANGNTVVDGPFSEAKELIAGFWIIETRDFAEAVEWARRAPMLPGDQIEVRQVFASEDFMVDVDTKLAMAQEMQWRNEGR